MQRALLLTGLLSFVSQTATFGCECGPPSHASRYAGQASVIFVGKVAFTDDDGSGQFIQHTLVRFKVEESFKGLPSDAHDVWIDPGSCTSCYAEYKVGERYLVFAYGGSAIPKDSTAMSTANSDCRVKPLPKSIDQQNPPKKYLAPECSGTREIVAKTDAEVAREINWLRQHKEKLKKSG